MNAQNKNIYLCRRNTTPFFFSDDLPLTAAISLPLYALLREKLQRHLAQVLRQATSVSEVMYCNPSLMEAYR